MAFFNWLDVNKRAIGEKWYTELYEKGKDAEATCDTAAKIMGTSLWMFNMIANCGVLAGIGPNSVQLQDLAKGLDKVSTLRILHLISSCMCLQGLPKEIAMQEIPMISSKKFSLQLFAKEH